MRMKAQKLVTEFDEYAHSGELPSDDARLLEKAREATSLAYAPYSHFHVAAAALLDNGQILTGTNQENASFPVGICAERVLLSAISSQYPTAKVISMAITFENENGESNYPVTPCGVCRQSLFEFESRNQQPIRLIMGGKTGAVYVLHSAHLLLPLAFTGTELRRKK